MDADQTKAMTKAEKDRQTLNKALELKDAANNAYLEKNYPKAIQLYHQTLLNAKILTQMTMPTLQNLARMERSEQETSLNDDNAISETSMNEPGSSDAEKAQRLRMDSTSRGEEIKSEALELISKCYNNLAACILNGPVRKKDDYLRAVSYCDNVLSYDANNEKALFRKGSAYMKAELYEKAIDCFEKCEKNAQAAVLIDECKRKEVEDRRKREEKIRQNFAKAREAELRNGHAERARQDAQVNQAPVQAANGSV